MADETILRATLDTSGFSSGELKLLVSINNINQAVDGSGQKFSEHEAKMSSLQGAAEALSGALGILAAGFSVSSLIEANAEYDKFSVQLQTVTGSAAGAKLAINDLIQFANTSPYTLAQVTQAFVDLRNAGLDSTTSMLTSLTNVASSMGKPIGEITQSIASAAVGNTEALRTFGIELNKTGDKMTATFQGVSTVINATGPSIEKYIAMLGDTVFAGDKDRQSQTIGGLQSTYTDSIQNVLRAVGDGSVQGSGNGFNNAFKDVIKDATNANNSIIGLAGSFGDVLGQAVETGLGLWKEYSDEVNTAVVGIGAVIAAGTGLAAVETALALITAVTGGWAIAIGLGAAALYSFRDHQIEVNGQVLQPIDAIKDAWSGVKIEIGNTSDALDSFLKNHPFLQGPQVIINGINSLATRAGQAAHNAVFGASPDANTVGPDGQDLSQPGFVQHTLDLGAAQRAQAAAANPQPTIAAPSDISSVAGFLAPAMQTAMAPYVDAVERAVSDTPNSPSVAQVLWQISQESGGNPNAVSGKHVGLGQFDAPTAAQYGLTDRTDPNASINAMVQKDADLVKLHGGSVLEAMRQYGTIQDTATETKFQTATQKDDPLYRNPNTTMSGANAAQLVSTLQTAGATLNLQGLQKAVSDQLVAAGLVHSNDDGSKPTAITQDQLTQNINKGQASFVDQQRFDKITQQATYNYEAPLLLKANTDALTVTLTEAAAAQNELGIKGQIAANAAMLLAQETAKGVPPSIAKRDADNQQNLALAQLDIQLAKSVATQRQNNTNASAINAASTGQGVTFDPNTNTYVLDTRNVDALKNYQQLNPNNLTGKFADDARTTATTQAQNTFDANRIGEANQRTALLANNSDPTAGLKVGWQSYYDDVTNINKGVATLFTDSMSGMNDALVNFVKTGKMSWGSLFTTISTDLANLAIKAAESQIFSAIGVGTGGSSVTGGSILNSIGGFLGLGGLSAGSASGAVAGAGGWASIPTNNAVGGVYGGGLGAYANSVVSSPTYFAGSNNGGQRFASGTADLMGEAGPEAIIPLKRGADGSLGVRVSGAGGGGGSSISVGDINITNAQVDGGGSMSPQMAAQLQNQVAQQVQAGVMKVLSNQQRPGGSLYGAGRR